MSRAAGEAKPVPGSLTALKGVGPAVAEKLGTLGVRTPGDLLFLLPIRYEDRTRLSPMGSLLPGQRVVVQGEIELAEVAYRGRRNLLCRIADGTGHLTLRFFHFSMAQSRGLQRGLAIRCYGEVRAGSGGLEMIHPEYRVLTEASDPPMEKTLTPIYPGTQGLQQARLRRLVDQALDSVLPAVEELIPKALIQAQGLPPLAEALAYAHRPPPDADLASLTDGTHACIRRLALEELLAQHLAVRQLRHHTREIPAPPLAEPADLLEAFTASLGFTLTGDQKKVAAEITADLAQAQPMLRLVQGDVGCGKTVVAAMATLHAVAAGSQTAIMAPTELLAEQHRESFSQWLEPLGVTITWLAGSLGARQRRQALEEISSGESQLVIGTHALFQDEVEFSNLALVVVDEQHRFGVHQRLRLMDKGSQGARRPHQLVMTATPIPRTLAMTLYADLDTSVIREMPPGRLETRTVAIPDRRRTEVVERVREACQDGRQAYWVCPLVEESEVLESQAAESTYEMLSETLPEVGVGLIHGRMKTAAKDKVMQSFSRGEIRLLVATTVIEVGVNVPSATLMIIENAERMGLSQLHQLRGRVGRGRDQATCVLIYHPPLGQLSRQRLKVMRETTDGFEIARKDLELRGPGEVLGTRQTGVLDMRVADLARDAHLLPQVQSLAKELETGHPQVMESLIRRWVGSATQYADV